MSTIGAASAAAGGFADGSADTPDRAVAALITRSGPAASSLLRLLFVPSRHGIELQAMPDQIVAEPVGDDLLQFLDLLVAEFDHPAALQIDQVIVMRARHFLIARA